MGVLQREGVIEVNRECWMWIVSSSSVKWSHHRKWIGMNRINPNKIFWIELSLILIAENYQNYEFIIIQCGNIQIINNDAYMIWIIKIFNDNQNERKKEIIVNH